MDNTKKAKPMEALKLLSEPHRRLVNKLITGLHSGEVDEKTKNCINLCIYRSIRGELIPKTTAEVSTSTAI